MITEKDTMGYIQNGIYILNKNGTTITLYPTVPLTSPPVILNHFNRSVCAPLVILKCRAPLFAVSVEYTVSCPLTDKSPDT